MLSPGDMVKDCEVIAPLGSGGMARLYLARRRGVGGFSRLVTLKLVHPHLIEEGADCLAFPAIEKLVAFERGRRRAAGEIVQVRVAQFDGGLLAIARRGRPVRT